MQNTFFLPFIIAELIFLTTALTVAIGSTEHAFSLVTVAETEIQATGDQLLVITNAGLRLVSLQSNSSTLLFKASFTDVAHESVHGEVATLLEYGNNMQAVFLWDTNDLLRPVSLKLTAEPC